MHTKYVLTVVFLIHAYTNYLLTSCDIIHTLCYSTVSIFLYLIGQYDGKSKPIPEYHAKIAGFDSKILVLGSMRKPKRLTIIGDNSKEYMFLVKGGEDLRHDQRIEQVEL